jgi:hypothetical protein
MSILHKIGLKYGTDKTTHGYCPHYERHLPPRDAKINLLEIGIFEGSSLRMWQEYFFNATIYGVDIQPDRIFQDERIITFCGDATSEDFWNSISLPEFNVIIDDGSHQSTDIVKSYNILWPQLPKGGLYIIEDLAVQWYSSYGGAPNGSDAIRELENRLYSTLQTNDNSELHIYTELAIIKK